jgi:murein L,D-transpeptidase YcbB/YkuD
MVKRFLNIFIITWMLCCCRWNSPSDFSRPLKSQLQEMLRNRIEDAGVHGHISVGSSKLYSVKALPLFYERRMFRPAWVDNYGPTFHAKQLIHAIRRADKEGLRPEDYNLNEISRIMPEEKYFKWRQRSHNSLQLVDMELLLTDAFLLYGSHLLSGRINPETIDPEWFANRRGSDLSMVLEHALTENRIEEILIELAPSQDGYATLRRALVHYRAITARGGWPRVPVGAKLQKEDSGPAVALLWQRLMAEHANATGEIAGKDVFDEVIKQAVREFQQRYGLKADGRVGPATLAALNVSAEDRVDQILLNMERWRWLPQDLGRRHIIVNIADFKLQVMENGRPVLEMKIIVGKGYRRTVVFSDKITYLVLNPSWQIPLEIAVKDKLPLIRKDPEYFTKQNIRVFQGWGAESREIDPKTVNWSAVTPKTFTYRLRQDPGPQNALGRIKFMFPNRFNIYIHDTPYRTLFDKASRTFSSGCIRIEKPLELAAYLLNSDPKWHPDAVQAALEQGEERTIQLPESIPVHLLYWTVFVDSTGKLQFRPDIYNRDKRLNDALRKKAP